jgi:SagB-type dehydrogenase family enzyme
MIFAPPPALVRSTKSNSTLLVVLSPTSPGLYHFAPAPPHPHVPRQADFALRKLRAGDHRGVLVDAAAAEPSITQAPVVIICTGTYWRNAWKYQARTYRHFGWDNGTLLANLLAMSTALELPSKILCGFVDDAINRLLDLDIQREVAFPLLPFGKVAEPPPEPPKAIPPLGLEIVPLSQKEVDYPTMRACRFLAPILGGSRCLARETSDYETANVICPGQV